MSVNAATFQMRPNAQGFGVPRELWATPDELTALGVTAGAPVIGSPSLGTTADLVALSVVAGSPVVGSPTVDLAAEDLPDYYDADLVPATLWVNGATGSDSYTRAQVLAGGGSVQWATIGRAAWGSSNYSTPNSAEAAQAGDVVQVAGGVYWEGTGGNTTASGSRFIVCLNPANSGTSESPIIFRSNPASPAEIRMQDGIRGPAIGSAGRSYIYWHGFRVNDYYCGSNSDTGPVHFGDGAQGCRLTGCNISGHSGTYYWGYATFGGNYRLVSLQGASNCTVADNKIWRAWDGASSGGQNEGGILTYDSPLNTYEHNHFLDCGVGVFIKGIHLGYTQNGNVIRRNLVEDCPTHGIRVLGGPDSLVYQNIVINGNTGLLAGWGDESAGSRFVNNTVVQSTRSLDISANGSDIWFRNNIVVSGTYAWYDYSGIGGLVSGRNLFHDIASSTATSGSHWFSEGTSYTFPQFQALGQEVDSVYANPLFTGASDYTLQAGSPALTLGRDYLNLLGGGTGAVIPVGCYITGDEIIGPRIAVPGD